MTNRIVLILVCLCISQSQISASEVVKFRFALGLKEVQSSEFNPINKLLAVKRKDDTVRIIDLTDGRERAVLILPNKKPVGMYWSPDGLRLLITNEKFTVIWDRAEDKLMAPDGLQQKDFLRAGSVEWSPSATTILSSYTDRSIKAAILDKEDTTIRVWCAQSGELKFKVQIKGMVGHTQFSSDGKLLLTSGWYEDVRLWDVETGRLLATFAPPGWSLREGSSGEFSPDGKSVVVHTYGRGIFVYDCRTRLLKTTVHEEEFGEDRFALLGFSPDGKVLAIYREHLKGFHTITSIELRDGETSELKATLTGKNMLGAANQWVWTSDGQTLITGGGNTSKSYEGKIWEITTGRLKAKFPMILTYSRIPLDFGYKNRDALSVHPTLSIVSAVNEKFTRLWNAETGELVQTLDNARGAKWSADGTLLLTYGKDFGFAQVWDVVSLPGERQRRTIVESSLRLSAYLCDLCVEKALWRRERRDTQRAAEKFLQIRTPPN
jgi:WD40 repeat protein